MQEWLELGPDAAVVRPLDQARAALLGNGWLTAGLLYRRDARPSEAGAPPVPEWTLYIELSAPGTVRQAQASGDQPAGFLRLWLGPFNAPTDILRINADGSVVQQAGPNPQPAPSIRIANEEGHWACWMPVPAAAVEADGSIRIAVERVDSRGVRSAWPRAMLPWQREPGRAVLTTRSWGGVMGSN
jgi:hypothetical protein